jgi:GH18 family chitinase
MNGIYGCLNAMVAEKRNPDHKHVKVLISVGGALQEDNFSRIARDHNLRHIFAASVKAFLDHYGLDGVDSKF